MLKCLQDAELNLKLVGNRGSKSEGSEFTHPAQLQVKQVSKFHQEKAKFSHDTAQAHLNKPKLCQNYTRFFLPCQNQEKPSTAPGPGQGSRCRAWIQTKTSSRFQNSSVVHSSTTALHCPAPPCTTLRCVVCSPFR